MFSYYKQRELHFKERSFHDRRIIFDSLILGLASPQQIETWTQRRLTNGTYVGEVLHAKTVDYKTFKSLRDGLFCERIFGPVKDYMCACGKQQPNEDVTFCTECEVEYGPSTLRRRRLGHINLFSSVTHIWYLKGRPNYISALLWRKNKSIDALVYCMTVLIDVESAGVLPTSTKVSGKALIEVYTPSRAVPVLATSCCDPLHKAKFLQYFTSHPYPDDQHLYPYTTAETSAAHHPTNDLFSALDPDCLFTDMVQAHLLNRDESMRNLLASTGGDAVAALLDRLDLSRLRHLLACEIRAMQPRIKAFAVSRVKLRTMKIILRRLIRRRTVYIRRFKILDTFYRSNKNPSWMTLSVLPVLPPDLRPILVVNQQVMASDLNRLYQRVLFRNNRMKRLRILDLENIGYTKRLLQEAVDALIENGKGGTTVALGTHNQPLKSLSDRLKGKRGRFRLNLLGKRVDYSGRSVIVVGPKLKVHACGLPREMALELFYPFLIRRLLEKSYAKNIIRAKRYIARQDPIIWRALMDILGQLPILLNRAPTLHRLGIQAFRPYLVAGQAISLHPLVCSAFNADFDGDQMAVHVPLSFHARAEAWRLLWSRNNLLAPATGQPILIPSQDMVLGCYYLTTDGVARSTPKSRPDTPSDGYGMYFASPSDAMTAFHQDLINLRSQIWLQIPAETQCETTDAGQLPNEIQVSANGNGLLVEHKYQDRGVYVLSSDDHFFIEYMQLLWQYIRTTAGRILFNDALSTTPPRVSPSTQEHLDKEVEALVSPKRMTWEDLFPDEFGPNLLDSSTAE
uniref:DNA-directed RNA polymerase subunit n=1 Tax=Choricystis parasitica TaxID=41300 RepID=A0A097KNY1_9CHLO|nr:beta' subunit of RNA polymerase [Choricystis parasitica]AIT94875.1 beta' subunit of RNA polymerase [Choricystis parasitica]